MELISDGLLFLAAVTASLYCLVLSRRLRQLTETDGGLGQMITHLSVQVDEMQTALATAKKTTESSAVTLMQKTAEAEKMLKNLRLAHEKISDATTAAKAQRALLATVLADCEDVSASSPGHKSDYNFIGPVAPRSFEKVKTRKADFDSENDKPSDNATRFSTADAVGVMQDPVQDDEAEEVERQRTAKPTFASMRSSQVPEAVGAVLAAGRTDDDEAFARRLIDALAGSEAGLEGAVT